MKPLTAVLLAITFCITAQATPTLDLTTAGAEGMINGAIFRQFDLRSSGSGVFDTFLKIKDKPTEEGYNTDYRPPEFDENTSPQITRSLLLSSVPIVNIGGTNYREFLLDIDQDVDTYLSLDELKISLQGSGNLTGYA